MNYSKLLMISALMMCTYSTAFGGLMESPERNRGKNYIPVLSPLQAHPVLATKVNKRNKNDLLETITSFSIIYHTPKSDYPEESFFFGLLSSKSIVCGIDFPKSNNENDSLIKTHLEYFKRFGEISEKFTSAEVDAAYARGIDLAMVQSLNKNVCADFHKYLDFLEELEKAFSCNHNLEVGNCH